MGNILVIALLSITALLLPMAGTEYKPSVQVIRVTSPDSFKAYYRRQETDVKLIGVKVPERPEFDAWVNGRSFTPEEKAALYEQYRLAETFLQERIHRGDKLTIEYDMKRNDNSGRVLAYVYLPDGRMLNEMMVAAGLAYPEVDPDNVRRMQAYTAHYNAALRNQTGLWRYYNDTTGPTVFNPPPKQQSWFSAAADSLNPVQQSFTFMVYNVRICLIPGMIPERWTGSICP
jgi:micrococcal nuclease